MSVELLAMVAVLPFGGAHPYGRHEMARNESDAARVACLRRQRHPCLGLSPEYVAALTLQGIVTAIGVLIIVFGAILILFTLEKSGGMETSSTGCRTSAATSAFRRSS